MAKSKVLISDKISESGLSVLKEASQIKADYRPGLNEAELADAIRGFDGLIIRSGSKVTAQVLEKADRLRVIGRAGIGVDNVDVVAASKRGIVVMNTPTGNSVTTAEHALSLLLSIVRKIPQAASSMREGKWEKSKFQGREVANKTLGVVGLGNIGRIVAERAKGLKMQVIGYDPVVSQDRAASLGVKKVQLDELFAQADFITIHAPLTEDTRNLINDATIDKMKKGVYIINAARGGIVDEAALARAVQTGKVAGAALDVFEKEPVSPDNPLLKLDQVVCTPHLGASTAEAQERVAVEIAQQVAEFLEKDVVKNAVNAPTLPAEVADQLDPYVTLGRKLGSLLGQLGLHDVVEVAVTCRGAAGRPTAKPVACAALAGFLEHYLEEHVSVISAPYLAHDRGVSFVQSATDSSVPFPDAVEVAVRGKSEHRAVGTLNAEGEARLVCLDGCELEAVLSGAVMISHNEDLPGVIGSVGTVLGSEGINISRMQVGLRGSKDASAKEAIALWNLDSRPSDASLENVRQQPSIRSAICLSL